MKATSKTTAAPFAAWHAALLANIRTAIRTARRNGCAPMGQDTLRLITAVPPGGPTGTNVAYYYHRHWFPEAVQQLKGPEAAFVVPPAP